MKTINVTQGSPEWAALRAQHNTASEAPVMMGASKYQTRDELLRQKATGIVPEVGRQQQALFDRGHATEAAARAILEEMTGEDFYPITAVSDDGTLLASVDGITLDDSPLFEHKLWNENLAARVRAGDLEPHYYWQLEQQLLVTGAEKVIFVCSDGTKDNWAQMEYLPVPGRAEQLVAGWAQFDADRATYVPTTITEMPKAEVTVSLPALFIHAKGEITTSNMKEYGEALAKKLKSIRAIQLLNDQDFSNAKESAKLLRENIEAAKLAKDAMLAQTVTVGEAARMIDAWCEDMRLTALQLEKDVEREDKAKKANMILDAKGLYDKHIEPLHLEIEPILLTVAAPVFAEAIKNKRSFASMQDAIDTMLANAKIAADAEAKDLRAKLAWIKVAAEGKGELFRDLKDIIRKPTEDFQLTVNTRLNDQKVKDDIAAEKVIADAAARITALAVEAAKPVVAPAAAPVQQNAPQIIQEIMQVAPAANVVHLPTPQESASRILAASLPAAKPTTPPTLKLGQIGERLGFALTGDFLKTLGFEPAARDKSALLFHESSFPLICAALVQHIEAIQSRQAA